LEVIGIHCGDPAKEFEPRVESLVIVRTLTANVESLEVDSGGKEFVARHGNAAPCSCVKSNAKEGLLVREEEEADIESVTRQEHKP
jgi:NAD-dependent SIR2 family protein deacetylase